MVTAKVSRANALATSASDALSARFVVRGSIALCASLRKTVSASTRLRKPRGWRHHCMNGPSIMAQLVCVPSRS